ncbi:MAG: hypothetical protein M3Q32_06530 [Pseudomonadota bacterium]|nr:hypothetical protein [Pseudomonadota bacterium]
MAEMLMQTARAAKKSWLTECRQALNSARAVEAHNDPSSSSACSRRIAGRGTISNTPPNAVDAAMQYVASVTASDVRIQDRKTRSTRTLRLPLSGMAFG